MLAGLLSSSLFLVTPMLFAAGSCVFCPWAFRHSSHIAVLHACHNGIVVFIEKRHPRRVSESFHPFHSLECSEFRVLETENHGFGSC